MFICSECGTKYEIMPKFCDCGNDIFIEEKPQPQPSEIPEEKIPAEQPRRRTGRGKVESFSPVAIGSFVLCLILSLVILFFVGNPKKDITAEETTPEQKTEEKIDIPAIDTFWDNTAVKTVQKEEAKEEPKETLIIDIMPKFVQNILPQEPKKEQTPVVNKPVSATKTAAPKTTTSVAKTPAKTTQQTAQKTTATPKTTTPNTQTQAPNTQAQSITNRIKNKIQYNNNNNTAPNTQTVQQQSTTTKTTNTQTAPTQTKTAPTTQITHSNTVQQTINTNPAPTTTPVITTAPVVKTRSQSELTKELNTYKASLRNTIGRKIDFTKVIGDGDCALTFKINSSGRLTSKAFTKQSSNITLNDAVFSAMNSVTSYNPPPEGYKGEALTLKIRFYNGNFEITLN